MKALLALLLAAASLFAQNTYRENLGSNVSELQVPVSRHGLQSTSIGVRAYDGLGKEVPATQYTYATDANKTVTVRFTPAASGGSVLLIQGFEGPDTTAATDMEVTAKAHGNSTLKNEILMCATCTAANYAKRAASGRTYVMVSALRYLHYAAEGDYTVRVFFEGNKVVFGLSAAGGVRNSCFGGPCEIRYGVAAFPEGAVRLGESTFESGFGFRTVLDHRPWR